MQLGIIGLGRMGANMAQRLATLETIVSHLAPGDIVIDGGNS
ncbi:MAG TPA: hypothetical protein VFA10_22740 [Ktedonobacteraceae bacterium]|jgi:6-phosphogluconate dehydrogenase (decarboxylating)|nr:hypothetical protein [Ktedonobacteraceae bacterium]